MEIRIAEKIRAFRKERKLTQEQLAELLGVTVGAVSKWESGMSVPELPLIVEMADFFETSVDVLLGYEWHSGSLEETMARIRALRNEKRFAEAAAEAEKALKKYPNRFKLVFQCAVLYSLKGVEEGGSRSFLRALALFERSLELIGQNTDERVNEWSIRNHIAEVYACMGQTDKALEQLRANNADGLNNGDIGYTLAVAKRQPDEALPYLSEALVDFNSKLLRVMMGYANAYCDKEEYDRAIGALRWMVSLVEGLRREGAHSYLDREIVTLLTGCAQIHACKGDFEAARDDLRQARAAAVYCDEQPEYGFSGMRFFHGENNPTGFDDFGGTALEGVRRMLAADDDHADELLALWDGAEN